MKTTLLTVVSMSIALSVGASGFPKMPSAGGGVSDDQKAIQRYNSGLQHLERAAALEKDADPKQQAKARGEFEKAAKDFHGATLLNEKMYQAWTEEGFALRKSGKYDEALQSYDRALQLKPNLSPALEYRAEAWLGLDRVEEAKQTYMLLFSGDRARADELAAAMKQWLEKRKSDPGSVSAETIGAFEKWLTERQQVATQTSDLRAPKQSW